MTRMEMEVARARRVAKRQARQERQYTLAMHRAVGPLRRVTRHGESWAVEYSSSHSRRVHWRVESWHSSEDEARRAAVSP